MVEFVTRKSMKIRPSGRSTDFISPSFGFGCLYNCTYCYMKRHKPIGLTIATNTDEILNSINNHVQLQNWSKIPNQTHDLFYTYDISCNEDFCLHLKYHDWNKIFDFFKNHPKAFGSMATKYVNKNLLSYNPENKIRIRLSLMPEKYRQQLEPKTSTIQERLDFIIPLIESGYDVHLNFSPVIYVENEGNLYVDLFKQVANIVPEKYRHIVKSEVIFLTHNEKRHKYNLDNNLTGEKLIWRPDLQEIKTSHYGGKNLRYNRFLKSNLITEFKKVHNNIIPWNTIRYIF